jgi:hypothetical protein
MLSIRLNLIMNKKKKKKNLVCTFSVHFLCRRKCVSLISYLVFNLNTRTREMCCILTLDSTVVNGVGMLYEMGLDGTFLVILDRQVCQLLAKDRFRPGSLYFEV